MNGETVQLPPLCVRSLNDKMFEKKKAACRQIEIMTKEWNSAGQTNNIRKLIATLVQDFIITSSGNSKIGGLVAISSVAIALDKDAKIYLDDIIKPIFECAHDCQRDVRYRTLEALYNVVKCIRGDVLIYLNEIFDIIIRLCEDGDGGVRDATTLMDKLVKDIVIENPSFNIINFIGIIRERIYALTPNTRRIILSWINFLDSVPDIDMLIFIPDILDGLLKISCDANKEIRRTAEAILCEFYNKILDRHEEVEFKPLIKILLIHVQTDSYLVQSITLGWLSKFIMLANRIDILNNSAHILAAILPCLSYARLDNVNEEPDDMKKTLQKNNTELSKCINEDLMNLVTKFKHNDGHIDESFVFENESNKSSNEDHFNISKILIVLINELELGPKTSTQTKIAILEWILQIYINLDIQIDENLESKLLDILLNTLPDTSDSVVLMDLKVLGQIIFKSSSDDKLLDESKRCKKLLKRLVELFFKNNNILKERGPFIICQLCNIMDSRKVYISFSEILLGYERKFIHSMAYILNTILLTSKELSQLRNDLRNMDTNNEAYHLFEYLYKTWCYSPVSVISLCLLTKCYKHASKLILLFSNFTVTIDILMEIDQLIQLLESPIFTSLRLDLLDSGNNYYLCKSLYGLLMLLPQSDAFHLLRKRLQCVPNFALQNTSTSHNFENAHKDEVDEDFDQLLAYYEQVQKIETSLSSN